MTGLRRQPVRVLLVVVSALLLAATAVAGYARYELSNRDAFAARATAALEDPGIRTVVGERVVGGLSEHVAPEALIAAPLVAHGVAWLAGTRQFKRLFARAVRERHKALAEGHTSFVFELVPGAGSLLEALRAQSPRLASAIPSGLTVPLISLRPRSFELRTARGVSDASGWFVPLLLVTCLALAASALIAGGLGPALTSVGTAIAGAGLLVAGLVTAFTAFLVAHAASALDLDAAAEREALHALVGALFGDLRTAGLIAALGGLILAVLPQGRLLAHRATVAPAALGSILRSERPGARRARGLALILLGAALVLEPGFSARAAAVTAGALALAIGVSEVVGRWLEGEVAPARAASSSLRVGSAVAIVVVATLVGVALVLPAPSTAPATGSPAAGCNGETALCDRTLNEVAFPATHNSFAAADERGWYFPNQRFGIARQLRDGITGFLIDVHYGIRDPRNGRIRTPLTGEGSSRNKVAQELGPEALKVADRLAGRVGAKLPAGPRDLYLCHTLCELGAEPLEPQLKLFARYLATHKRTVLTLVVEPYMSVPDFERAMRRAGLLNQAAELRRDEPLPTLNQLIERGKRLIVLAERGGGARQWYLSAFSFIQDTPYQATSPRELSCRRYRGTADSPLFLVNHWIATFPPSPRRNRDIGSGVLERRLARCGRERSLMPNLVAVDFYDRSDVVPAARALNRRAAH